MFRNEIVFYRRECELCHKNTISIFSPDRKFKIYCSKCWWSDNWNPGDFYLDYNPNKNFFTQFKELQLKTYFFDRSLDYSTLVNCEYVNYTGNSKNCYFIFNADFCDNVYYSAVVNHMKDSSDCLMMNKTELSYGCIGGDGSSVFFSENCPESINVWYSKDCIGCINCFGCVNLRNKSNYIFNESVSKEEFKKKVKEMELDKYSSNIKVEKNIYDFWDKFPRKYMYERMNSNVSGSYVYNSKNAKNCYQAVSVEDGAYSQFITLPTFRDAYDITEWGNGLEFCIDSVSIGEGVYEIKYSDGVFKNSREVEYSMYGIGIKNCFGCINLRKKEYCILNKQYSKEEYEKLRLQIIDDMNLNPYIDSKGRIWKYGDFFPYDLSPFSYNESFANQYFPLDKKEIEESGFSYSDLKKPDYQKTIELEDIPDSIYNIKDDFINEIIQCSCSKFYKIMSGELQLLKKFGLPIPRICPDCRYLKRIKRLNSPIFYDRNCDKCGIKIITSYPPNISKIVYCDKCYQSEVY